MSILEVLLLLFGAGILTAGYLLPAKRNESAEDLSDKQRQQIRDFFDREMEEAETRIEEIVDETVSYSIEKTERSMERLSNEKIMAINEYSDTVLHEINKNHEEAVFLYDMLNNKHNTFKATVSEAGKKAAEVKQTLEEAKEAVQFAPIQPSEVQDMGAVLKKPEPARAQGESEEAEPAAPKKKRAAGTKRKQEASSGGRVEEPPADQQLPEEEASAGNNNDKILELHKAGKSNVAIAKELGLGVGEVKLVIDLYQGTGG